MGKALEAEYTLSEEVPVGYKRTEVGMIPEEWSIQKLETICDVRDGTHDSPRFYSTGVPLITSKNIVNGSLDLENISCISEQDADRINKRSKVDLNDILMSMIGTIGSTVLIDFEPDFCIKNVALIKPQKVLPTFLIHLMASPSFQTYLKDSLDGGIQKFIALGTLRYLNIPLPPPTEQRAIAEVLSDMDGLLDALEELISKKRAVKQAAMQQLLTDKTRLPGFSEKWETKRLGELEQRGDIELFRGKVISQKDIDRQPGDYPIYSSSVHLNGLFGSYGDYMFDEELITWSVDGGGHFFYRPKHRFSVTNVCGYMRIRTSSIDYRYLAYHLQNEHSRKVFDYTLKAHPSVIRSSYNVVLPQLNEQRAIAAVLSDIDAETAALERRRDKARAIKQGMMQQLLTGQVRLIKPDLDRTEV